MWATVGGRDRQRGAAAVEAALLFSAVLVPLLLGVINYGYYFWQLQRVPELDPAIDQSGIVGTFCTGELPDLLTRVRQAALIAVDNLDTASGEQTTLSLSDITASVVTYTPDSLGLVVQVGFSSPAVDELIGFLPLPDDGRVVSSTRLRLENVKVSSGSC